jgi:signal transduction histidine kinase
MLEKLRQSLALWLAFQYALVFAVSALILFGALYWVLARALEERDQAVVERRAAVLARAYAGGQLSALVDRLNGSVAQDGDAWFVRVIDQHDGPIWVKAPPDWVQTVVQRIPIPEWGVTAERAIPTVRLPRDALRDYAIASRMLFDGRLIQVGRSADNRAVLLAPLRRAFGTVGAVVFLFSVAAGTMLAWRATRPLREVSDTARRILETGDFAARVRTPHGSGELAVLVRQLNTLLNRNATHVRVLRETLDNLAHDLRTPLARLRGAAELALQNAQDPAEARAGLADCVDECDRVLHLLEALLDISAAEAGALKLNRERIDASALAERALDLYREVADEKKITVSVDQPALAEIDGDAIRLSQAINNLLDNALKYTPVGGNVALATRVEADFVVITVTDNGPGVPLGEREAIFRRLYRSDTSRSRRGLGLGLSLVKAIVEAHGGTITARDAPGGGARFTMRLRRAHQDAASPSMLAQLEGGCVHRKLCPPADHPAPD